MGDLMRMNGAAFANEVQQHLRALSSPAGEGQIASQRDVTFRSRMHERLKFRRDEAVIDEKVFLDPEFRIKALEISGAIILDAMAKDQVLRARWRANSSGTTTC